MKKISNIWIIGHVDSGKRSLKAAEEFNKFCKENPELVQQILRENRETWEQIKSSENPYKYLCDNPHIAKRLDLTNEQILAVFWLSQSKWNTIH